MPNRSRALAFAWQLWLRHRWGATIALATFVAVAVAVHAIPLLLPAQAALLFSVLPLIGIFGYFMNALLFVPDVGNLSSGYPQRMFALPVPTRTLVFWPMFSAAAMLAILWLATVMLIYRPLGFNTPVLLPILGLAAIMAWLQALSWSPLQPAWVRPFVAVGLVGALLGLALVLAQLGNTAQAALGAILAVALLMAVPVAIAGVASERRGDRWRVWPEWHRASRGTSRIEGRPFRSAAEAQLWYEWRCHGMALPSGTAAILLFVLTTEGLSRIWHVHPSLPVSLALILGIPAWLAVTAGPGIGRLAPFWVKRQRDITFLAIRPMSSGELVAAKFQMGAWSVLLTLGVTLVAMLVRILLEGSALDLPTLWTRVVGLQPGMKTAAAVALALGLGPIMLWRILMDYSPISLTGRTRAEYAISIAAITVVTTAVLAGIWCQTHAQDLPDYLVVLPWLVAVVLVVKVIVTAWAFRAAIGRGLIAERNALAIVGIWLAVVLCAFGLARVTMPAGMLPTARNAALLGIALFIPLGRFALAPLALDWNRHR